MKRNDVNKSIKVQSGFQNHSKDKRYIKNNFNIRTTEESLS